MKPQDCKSHPGCTWPHCYCQVDDQPAVARPVEPYVTVNGQPIGNFFKDKVDLVTRELERTSIALDQFKRDLKDAELANQVLITGILDLMEKYRSHSTMTNDASVKLAYSIVVEDLRNVIRVSQVSAEELLRATAQTYRKGNTNT